VNGLQQAVEGRGEVPAAALTSFGFPAPMTATPPQIRANIKTSAFEACSACLPNFSPAFSTCGGR
jgi:hypothetical protein